MKNAHAIIRKAQPTPGDVHVDTPLSNVSLAFMQSADRFVAGRVFPTVQVSKQTDKYFTFDRSYWFRSEMKKRAAAAESAGAGYAVSNDSYSCDIWALHNDIPERVLKNADAAVDPQRRASRLLTQHAMITREKEWVTSYFAASIWTTDWDGVSTGENGTTTFRQWNDAASTPVEDIRLAIDTGLELTGFRFNKLTVGRKVWSALVDHPDIVDRIKHTGGPPDQSEGAMRRAIAGILELGEILVMEGVENTAAEGATASYSFIGGKKALLSYAPASPAMDEPSAGYTFAWTNYAEFAGANEEGGRIKSWWSDDRNAQRVELEMAFDQKLVSADCGVFFDTIVA